MQISHIPLKNCVFWIHGNILTENTYNLTRSHKADGPINSLRLNPTQIYLEVVKSLVSLSEESSEIEPLMAKLVKFG